MLAHYGQGPKIEELSNRETLVFTSPICTSFQGYIPEPSTPGGNQNNQNYRLCTTILETKNTFAVPEEASVNARENNEIVEVFDLSETNKNAKQLPSDILDNLQIDVMSECEYEDEPLNYTCVDSNKDETNKCELFNC